MEADISFERLNELRIKILGSAEKKAKGIIDDAKHVIEDLNQGYEKEKRYFEQIRISEIEKDLKLKIADQENDLKREIEKKILKFKQDSLDGLIQSIIKNFKRKMIENQERYYGHFIKDAIINSLNQSSFPKYIITANPKDAEYFRSNLDFIKQFGVEIRINNKCLDQEEFGIIIEDMEQNVRFNHTLQKKLEANIPYLKTKLAQILFSTE